MAHTPETRRRAYEKVCEVRSKWISQNGPCRVCGSSQKLEVDHIDPKTKIHHAIWTWAINRRLAELAKCQVLCHECHLIKTKVDMGYGNHGASMYSRGECRCSVCKAGNTKKSADYRLRKKLKDPKWKHT